LGVVEKLSLAACGSKRELLYNTHEMAEPSQAVRRS